VRIKRQGALSSPGQKIRKKMTRGEEGVGMGKPTRRRVVLKLKRSKASPFLERKGQFWACQIQKGGIKEGSRWGASRGAGVKAQK